MHNRVQGAKRKKKCLTDIRFHPEPKVTAFTRPVRTMKYLGPDKGGQRRMAADGGGSLRAGLCGSERAAAKGGRIRHNSCHAQISDIFSSSVARVTLATPLRQQMGRQTSVCALPNTNPVLVRHSAPSVFPTCRGGTRSGAVQSSRLLLGFFF